MVTIHALSDGMKRHWKDLEAQMPGDSTGVVGQSSLFPLPQASTAVVTEGTWRQDREPSKVSSALHKACRAGTRENLFTKRKAGLPGQPKPPSCTTHSRLSAAAP